MLFPTIRFAAFFAVVLPVSWLLMPRPVRWRWFVVAASFLFYASWDARYTALLAGSILGNQVFAHAIHDASGEGRRRRTAVAVAANLAALGWFKYAGFLSTSAGSALGWAGVAWSPPVPNLVLPVGISFFTFQAISYVVDVGREKIRPVPLAHFATYLAFFPHLVAGPIVRAGEFLPQLRHRRDPRRVPVSLAFWLIVAGLFKKVVVSSYLASEIVDPLFAFPNQHGGIEALVGVYAYAIQIYADFSGYTDMAIGIALLLGFRFPENFRAPYTATSLQDFWRRWHMTLSRFLRDYLYVPLGGNQGGRLRTARNLCLTMLLGGLWHGAAWTFVAWGALHGGWLVAERWWRERGGSGARPLVDPHVAAPGFGYGVVLAPVRVAAPPRTANPWLGRLVTFHVVCLGWILFRAPDFDGAVAVLGRITGGSATVALNPMVVLVVAAMLAAQFVPAGTVEAARRHFASWSVPAQATALAGALVAVDVLGPTGVAPFIYFQF